MSMTEGAIATFILNTVESLLQCGGRLLCGVHEEAGFIRIELEHMRAFLSVIDSREQIDQQLQIYVKQVREASFKAEDILDDFALHFTNHDGHGSFGFIKNLKARRRIISEVERMKLTISTMSEECRRFAITTEEQGSSSITSYDREDALLLEEDELVGIEEPREQLIKQLLEGDSKLKVISVLGMGGLGKTTVLKKVYDNPRVKNHFQYHAWITVSQPLKVNELLKDMIEQLYAEVKQTFPKKVETMRNHGLKEVIKDFLQQSSYVFVLDDVWSIEAWNAVKSALPKGSGGRVILTSRIDDVAPMPSNELDSQNYRLKLLSAEDSWMLFCTKTFQDTFCPSHLVETSQIILRKCDGLPLAIVAISGLLKTSQRDKWETINNSLDAELRVNFELEFMKKILSLSYNELPNYLKSCFLYLSIFPEDHLIECKRLERLWIAEGFVEAVQGKTIEEVAEGYLKMLFDRNLIQAAETTSDGRPKTCHVHDILHKISILKSIDQSFAAIPREQDEVWPDKVRRVSIHNTLQNIQQLRTISQLRSLFLFGMADSLSRSSIHMIFRGRFRMLKVLDLQAAPLEFFPDEVVNFLLLRYLSLRDTKVKTIPSSIGKLRMLETLDLKHAYVTKLPAAILKLKRLRHLLVYRYEIEAYTDFNYKYGFKALPNIGALLSLQKLCFVEADQGDTLMTELGRLNQLRRLGIIKLRKEDGKALCSSIVNLSKLHALSVTSIEEDEIIDLQHLSSPPQCLQRLERLYLTGRLEDLPTWIPWVHSLVKLFLKGSRLKNDPLVHLQDLPNLAHLELLDVYEGRTLSFLKGGFKTLKVLGLDKFDELERINVEDGAMPYLEKLIIQRCNSLKKLPSGIEHLTKIKVLEFFDMPEELIETLHPDRKGEDTWKVAHIPQVYSTYLKGKAWKIDALGKLNERESSLDPGSVSVRKEPLNCWK